MTTLFKNTSAKQAYQGLSLRCTSRDYFCFEKWAERTKIKV